MHVRKNAAFPRFDIKKYILVIREIESICRRTALEPEFQILMILPFSIVQLLCSISLKNILGHGIKYVK
jgi:hypothetical protein